MMSRTLNSKTTSFNLMKFELKRRLGILILMIIGVLLICPSYMVIYFSNIPYSQKSQYVSTWIDGFSMFSAIFGGIVVVGLNLLNFSFLYKRNAADFMDSMPLKRSQTLLSLSACSFIFSIIPIIIGFISLSVVAATNQNAGLIPSILLNFVYVAVCLIAVCVYSLIFILASANVFDFLVSFFGINIGASVIGLIVCQIFNDFLIGYAGNLTGEIISRSSPLAYIYWNVFDCVYENKSPLSFFIVSAVLIVLFAIINILLYNKRKSENTGKAFAYKFMFYICAVIASLCGGFVFGTIFAEESGMHSPLFYIFTVIGAAVTSVVYGAITFRGFKTVKKSLIIAGISAVMLFGAIGIVKMDITDFSSYIPKDNIKYVTADIGETDIRFDNPEKAVKLHKAIINKEGVIAKEDYYGDDVTLIRFEYMLKNKKTVARGFYVNTDKVKNEISDILKSDERFDQMRENLNKSDGSTVDIYFYDNDKQNISSYLTKAEAKEFIDIYQSELLSGERTVIPLIHISEDNEQNIVNLSFDTGYYEFIVDNSFPASKEYLIKLNLASRNME